VNAVFLDRDGVINRKAPDGEYVTRWSEFQFLPGALDGLRLLAESNLPVIVATNQRGIALGAMTEQDLADIHHRMSERISAAGGRIDAIYHCPHDGGCECRKPLPGLFLRAAREHGLVLGEAAVVGDRLSDMEAAAAIGATRVLVSPEAEAPPGPEADYVASDLAAAARWLLSPDRGS